MFVFTELKSEIFLIFFFREEKKVSVLIKRQDFRNICFRGITSSFSVFFFLLRNTLCLPYLLIFPPSTAISGSIWRKRCAAVKVSSNFKRLRTSGTFSSSRRKAPSPSPSSFSSPSCYHRRRLLLAIAQFAKSRCSPIKVRSFSEILNPDLSFTLALPLRRMRATRRKEMKTGNIRDKLIYLMLNSLNIKANFK